ncbi:MAG: DUF1800 domain-containing protein [Phycisphaerae bacterium]|nr:DUF1800 domain-containing protein [Phycisphaerae bacterium]
MITTRRSFIKGASLFGTLAAFGVLGQGCRPLEERLADAVLGAEDGAFAPPDTPTVDASTHALQRLTFGPRIGDRTGFETLGFSAFLARQLQPESIDDTRCSLRIAAIEPLSEPRGEHYEFDPEEMLLAIAQSRIVRAVHSRRQLFELMVEFWTDHFNIVASKGHCRWVRFADEIEVIRPHAMGRFQDLVRASATSPAMLVYLDGHDNKVLHPGDRPNENYARELLELHTLGVDGGYTHRDVLESARCLSGWTYGHDFWRGRVSRVAFDPKRHDDGAKEVLGITIPAGGGEADLDRLLTIVCTHPSTARSVARRLCRAFIADPAPPAAQSAVAEAFRSSDGDIRTTLRALFEREEFQAARGNLFKRPFRFLVSALRATAAATDGGLALVSALRRMGQAPSEYPTPDGYPLEAAPWIGSLYWRWNLAVALSRGRLDGTRIDRERLLKATGSEDALVAHCFGRQPTADEMAIVQASGDPIAVALAGPAFQWH